MEEEKSAIEILEEFAKKTNREIEVSKKDYPPIGIPPRYLHRNYVIISSRSNPSVYFVSFNDDKAFGDDAMYSGLFFPISASASSVVNIRKRNTLDKLNPFLNQRDYSGLSENFSSQVIITANDTSTANKYFDKTKIQDLIIEALNLDPRIRVGINNIDVDIIPSLKNKSLLGIYISPQWLLDDSIIEKLFHLAEKLRVLIK